MLSWLRRRLVRWLADDLEAAYEERMSAVERRMAQRMAHVERQATVESTVAAAQQVALNWKAAVATGQVGRMTPGLTAALHTLQGAIEAGGTPEEAAAAKALNVVAAQQRQELAAEGVHPCEVCGGLVTELHREPGVPPRWLCRRHHVDAHHYLA